MTKIFVRKPKVVPLISDTSRITPLMVNDDHIAPMMAEEGYWVELHNNKDDIINKIKENNND
jgi:hypothetical protein